jgi:hypothetical protein
MAAIKWLGLHNVPRCIKLNHSTDSTCKGHHLTFSFFVCTSHARMLRLQSLLKLLPKAVHVYRSKQAFIISCAHPFWFSQETYFVLIISHSFSRIICRWENRYRAGSIKRTRSICKLNFWFPKLNLPIWNFSQNGNETLSLLHTTLSSGARSNFCIFCKCENQQKQTSFGVFLFRLRHTWSRQTLASSVVGHV